MVAGRVNTQGGGVCTVEVRLLDSECTYIRTWQHHREWNGTHRPGETTHLTRERSDDAFVQTGHINLSVVNRHRFVNLKKTISSVESGQIFEEKCGLVRTKMHHLNSSGRDNHKTSHLLPAFQYQSSLQPDFSIDNPANRRCPT